MKANELRIENFASFDGKFCIIKSVSQRGNLWILVFEEEYLRRDAFKDWNRLGSWIECSIENIKPIPLTEEWLLKFGCKKQEERNSKNHGPYFILSDLDIDYCFAFADFREDYGFYIEYTDSPDEADYGRKYFVSCGIKYVHQLQNLYFALTGKELELTEPM